MPIPEKELIMNKHVNIVFPHQLFFDTPFTTNGHCTYIIEEYLFFSQYPFHKQKLVYHRTSMKHYLDYLEHNGVKDVKYINAIEKCADIRVLINELSKKGYQNIHYINVCDDWLEKRIRKASEQHDIKTLRYQSPSFINQNQDLKGFFRADKKKFFLTSFYKKERQRLKIMVTEEGKPVGDKWSFDHENRKKYPKNKTPLQVPSVEVDNHYQEACAYINEHFDDNLGHINPLPLYPNTHSSAKTWLNDFLEKRFHEFGIYQDAIVKDQHFLNHSIISPMLNNGLLTPDEVVKSIVDFCSTEKIPINAQEGIIRQIIGWREYIRGVYIAKGVFQRTHNFWQFKRKIPNSFYLGNTGIEPVDKTIEKALQTGYSHHIERLMIIGNFMMLCEFDPDQVYQWFMEMYIDAYDWVMVPNVYGMSQFADGGLMSTKPYISGSNYLIKMSDYKKGKWCEIWDALFWRFLDKHQSFFQKNPRMSMLLKRINSMEPDKKERLIQTAENYLKQLDKTE